MKLEFGSASEVGHALHDAIPDRSLPASVLCNDQRGMLLDILTGMPYRFARFVFEGAEIKWRLFYPPRK